MKLKNILSKVRSTELRQMSDKDKTDEVLISYINDALLDIYSRFLLSTEEIIISLQAGKTVYALDGTDPDVEVNDSPIDAESIIALTEAFDERGEVPINDSNDVYSIYTVSYNKIQIPITDKQGYISIIYKQVPTYVEYEVLNDILVDKIIPLPEGLQAAVIQFIAYRANASASEGESTNYESQYENECQKALDRGVVPQDQLSRYVTEKGFI